MNSIASHKTRPQAYLHQLGAKRLLEKEGVDASVFRDVRVQRIGVIEAAKRAGRLALFAGSVVFGAVFIGDVIDRSPTMRHAETTEQNNVGKDLPGSVPYTAEESHQEVANSDVSSDQHDT